MILLKQTFKPLCSTSWKGRNGMGLVTLLMGISQMYHPLSSSTTDEDSGFPRWDLTQCLSNSCFLLYPHQKPMPFCTVFFIEVLLIYSVSFWCTAKWFSYTCVYVYIYLYIYTHILFYILSHCGLLQDTEYGSLCHTVGACVLSCFSPVWLFATPWTIACHGPLSMGFSRQEYWSGLSCPPPGLYSRTLLFMFYISWFVSTNPKLLNLLSCLISLFSVSASLFISCK